MDEHGGITVDRLAKQTVKWLKIANDMQLSRIRQDDH